MSWIPNPLPLFRSLRLVLNLAWMTPILCDHSHRKVMAQNLPRTMDWLDPATGELHLVKEQNLFPLPPPDPILLEIKNERLERRKEWCRTHLSPKR